jgi:hypothetical protein
MKGNIKNTYTIIIESKVYTLPFGKRPTKYGRPTVTDK